MSRFKIGDYDYQIPGSGYEALEWEIAQLKELISRVSNLPLDVDIEDKDLIAELRKVTE